MYTSQAPPAYLPTAAPPPPGAVTYYTTTTAPNQLYTTASVGNGSLQNFAVSPTAAGGALPQPIAMASSGTTVLVAPQGLMASSVGAAGPPGLSTSGAGSFAASSGHGSLSHPFSMPSLPLMSGMGGGPGMTGNSVTGNTNVQGVTFRNLKVGGLPPCVTDADLFDMFQRFGKIESAKVMLNVHTCESRGYGFVLYDTQEAGCRAFGEMNGKTLVLRGVEMTLDVKNSDWDGRQAVIEINSIYVRNIPNSVSDDELKKYFAQFGPIVNLSSRTAGPAVPTASAATVAPPAHTPGGSSVPSGVLSNHNNSNNLSITGPPSQTAEADNGSVASGHGGGGDGGSSTIEQQLQTLLDDDEASETGRTTTASGSTTEQRNTPVPQPPPRPSGQSLSLDPPSFASFDFTGEPLGKLAMVEFQTIDSARLAIAATHRMMVFPNASTPVLSKFADAPHVKEQRRNQRKMAQPLPVHPLTTQHPPPPLQPPPPQQQQYIAVVGSAQSFPSMSLSSNPAQPIAMSMPRFPEAVPLPVQLPRPGATHRLYYQGLLGLASDGTLFAIRPDVCVQVANQQQQAEGPGAAQQRHLSHAQQQQQQQQPQHPQQLYHAQLQAMSQPYHSPYHVHQTEHGKMIGPSGVIET